MTFVQRFRALRDASGPTDMDELYQLFDALPPVPDAVLIGEWTGGVFKTGHAGENQLQKLNWAGKSFRGANDVDPIVSTGANGRREANPIMGSARMRQVEYRGVMTASMIYDKHPIIDHFRLIDTDTLLGVMDRKGESKSLFFFLERLRD